MDAYTSAPVPVAVVIVISGSAEYPAPLLDRKIFLISPAVDKESSKTNRWPNVVENAALSREPHRIAFYLEELASNFHAVWNIGNSNQKLRFINPEDIELTQARAALGRAVAIVLASGLRVIGGEAVEEMR